MTGHSATSSSGVVLETGEEMGRGFDELPPQQPPAADTGAVGGCRTSVLTGCSAVRDEGAESWLLSCSCFSHIVDGPSVVGM